jgi:glucosamine--fructose-6-phosphate aminotransferase (isomerizing)
MQKEKDLKIITIKNAEKTPYIQQLEMSLSQIEKGGYKHFMLKEIFEQPQSVRDSMRGRLSLSKQTISLGGIVEYENKLLTAPRIIMIGCGTSWHAGLVGEYLLEELARVPVEVEYASEFRYRNPILNENDIIIAISQSGETADTLAAVKLAKSKGALPLGICNVVGSSIARETVAGSYTHAGPEIGVASTKAFTAQLTILTMLSLMLGYKKGVIPKSKFIQYLHDLDEIPDKMQLTLDKTNETIKSIAEQFKTSKNFLYLGRGFSYPVALEGALKLKEISYIHAEGYPAAEMKHGPIALIDENMPVVFIAPQSTIYDKIVSNIEEVKARKGKIISIISEGDNTVKQLSDYYIEIPKTQEFLSPLLATLPLQLLAYHMAVLRGCNVDQPRNLAKSVTVE